MVATIFNSRTIKKRELTHGYEGNEGGGGDKEFKEKEGNASTERDKESDLQRETGGSREKESEPAVLVKYRPLYRCGDRGHSGKRKSILTAVTHRSTHSPACV